MNETVDMAIFKSFSTVPQSIPDPAAISVGPRTLVHFSGGKEAVSACESVLSVLQEAKVAWRMNVRQKA